MTEKKALANELANTKKPEKQFDRQLAGLWVEKVMKKEAVICKKNKRKTPQILEFTAFWHTRRGLNPRPAA